jgi:hypothetical protein
VFEFLPAAIRTPLAFVIVLGVLVFIHELGHYLAARWRGVYVETFSIGFGRSIAQWTDRVGTVWKLAWLPLGGYVKMHGQERPQDVSDDIRAAWKPGETFHEKSVGSRAIIVAAGPIANFLLAAVLFAGLFAIVGRPVAGGDPEIWLHLMAHAEVVLQCQRCLQPTLERLTVDRRFRFVRNEDEAARLDEESEDDVLALPERLDLEELLEDELILGLPLVPRHGQCQHPLPMRAADPGADDEAPNPFAALAALRGKPQGRA